MKTRLVACTLALAREGGFSDDEIARLGESGQLEYLGRYACVEG